MDFTWGFLVIFIFLIIPGLLIRRLYYYGEFSKQFGYNLPLIKVVFYSLIPGILNVIIVFWIYDAFFDEIDLGKVIDGYKDMANPSEKFVDNASTPLSSLIKSEVFPFMGMLYTISIILGIISGRIIRMTGADEKFKLLRFNNPWFYLFNGHHHRLKKYESDIPSNSKFLFSKADVLIDTSNGAELYSGIVVDYELNADDCQKLSKVILRNAQRYKTVSQDNRIAKEIPGNLLVVNCAGLRNINLTFVFGQKAKKSILETAMPRTISIVLSILTILSIPLFIFKVQWPDWKLYQVLFELSPWARFFAYLLFIQTLGLLNPFREVNGKAKWITKELLLYKVILAVVFFVAVWLLA